MLIFSPHECNERTVYSILGQVFDEQGNLRSDRYEIDLAGLAEADAFGRVALTMLVYWLRRQLVPVDFVGIVPEWLSRAVVSPAGGLRLSDGVSLAVLNPSDAADWIEQALVPWLSDELLIPSTLARARTLPVKELLLNAVEHGSGRHIFASAHYEAEAQRVVCIVADDGIGIPQAVRRIWLAPISDAIALARAIERDFSSIRDTGHEGRGLSRLVETVVVRYRGLFSVHSGFGKVEIRPGLGHLVTRLAETDAFFPGTLAAITYVGDALGRIAVMNEPTSHDLYEESS